MEKIDYEEIAKLSYLAGIVDGEGTIGIHKSRDADRLIESYSLNIAIVNTDYRLVNWLEENFEGSVRTTKPQQENWKDKFEWRMGGYSAYKLLRKVRPFLIIKAEQAEVGINFWERCSKINNRAKKLGRPLWMIQRQEEYYERMRELNKRGRNETSETILKERWGKSVRKPKENLWLSFGCLLVTM